MRITFGGGEDGHTARVVVIRGDLLPPADAIAAAAAGSNAANDGVEIATGHGIAEAAQRAARPYLDDLTISTARLDAAGRAILRATAKPTDGIVSRYINRPISQSISWQMLKVPGFQPVHGTIGTGLLAVAMIACLLFGGAWGLIAGAMLFQAASIFDGVDGEVARATFRTTPQGAKMDSLVDAATNLSFLLGVAVNLHMQGRGFSASLGYTGLVLLAIGLFLIGRAAARSNAPFSFDLVKDHYRAKGAGKGPGGQPSRVMQWLTFLTSRDFFALVFAVLIAMGLAALVLGLFAIAAAGWLVAVILALVPKQA